MNAESGEEQDDAGTSGEDRRSCEKVGLNDDTEDEEQCDAAVQVSAGGAERVGVNDGSEEEQVDAGSSVEDRMSCEIE